MTTHLTISDLSIRQDEAGRYCLNDLHKSSGGQSANRPSKWLAVIQTQELIQELDAGILASEQNQSLRVYKGGNKWQGTFAIKELVYAYAMWISPKFHVAVIRAYDAIVTQEIQSRLRQLPEPATISKAQRGVLYTLVCNKARASGKARYSYWNLFLGVFGVASYEHLPAHRFDEARNFLQRLDEGEDPLRVYSEKEYEANIMKRIEADRAAQTLQKAMAGQRTLVRHEEDGGVTLTALKPGAHYLTEDEYLELLEMKGQAIVPKAVADLLRQIAKDQKL